MAITAPRKTSDFSGFLPAHIAAPIFEHSRQQSALMQLARRVPLSPNGESIPVKTGRPVAGWVDEGAKKPASQGSMTLKTMTPKKLACIVVNSMEVVEANPGGYITDMQGDLAEAFALAFDYAGFHNLGGDGTGTGPFSTALDDTTKSVELGSNSQANGGIYKDFVDSIEEVITDTDAAGRRYRATGFALDSLMETRLWGAVDANGRPLYTDLPSDTVAPGLARSGNLLGRASVMTDGVADPDETILGYVGDWSQVAWGVVGGIEYAVSDVATVTINGSLVSLWEQNLVAIRAEARFGFLVNDADAFVQLRNDTGS